MSSSPLEKKKDISHFEKLQQPLGKKGTGAHYFCYICSRLKTFVFFIDKAGGGELLRAF